jgi:hypothetical protein
MNSRFDLLAKALAGGVARRAARGGQAACFPEPTGDNGHAFDDLARALTEALPRREALRRLGGGLAATMLASLGLHKVVWGQAVQPAQSCTCNGVTYDPQKECCTPAGVQKKWPIENLAACPNRVKRPEHVPTPTYGCGNAERNFPDRFLEANFVRCCNAHDICYDTCNTNRDICDRDLFICGTAVCLLAYPLGGPIRTTCLGIVEGAYAAVRFKGQQYYDGAQKLACNCCEGDSCGCPSGQIVINGRCGCPVDKSLCNDMCVDTGTDPNNCGRCGNVCSAGQSCVSGRCEGGGSTCPDGLTSCNGVCVDTNNDLRNCGACGRVCPEQLNAVGTCNGGYCGGVCNAGYYHCDLNDHRGCETDIRTDPRNCGGCGNVCASGQRCVDRKCVDGGSTCPDGLTRCNGFCVDPSSDSNNCGACGNRCTGGWACRNGECQCPGFAPRTCTAPDGSRFCCSQSDQCCGNKCCISSLPVCCGPTSRGNYYCLAPGGIMCTGPDGGGFCCPVVGGQTPYCCGDGCCPANVPVCCTILGAFVCCENPNYCGRILPGCERAARLP